MRIQPRQQLLEIWQATARTSFRDGEWVWGGRHGRSSIGDAEQLLCMMLPATETPRFKLDRPDETDEDVRIVLRPFGDSAEIPRRLISALSDYMHRYVDDDGAPSFPGGSYLSGLASGGEVGDEERGLDIVESFAASIKLSLATIGFCRDFRGALSRTDLIDETIRLEVLASNRLTAAMVGLLRSFSINVFSAESAYGRSLLRTINQEKRPEREVLEEFQTNLREVRAGLRDYVTVGTGQRADLTNSRLFECGWSWGVIQDAPEVEFIEGQKQRDGYALDSPYLYFTVVALDGITDLFSRRTRLLGLLNDGQQRLARALQVRWDLTQNYWGTIASFGGRRWPLEDIPWKTVDDIESDYFTLLVTAIAARDLADRSDDNDTDLSRLGRILAELANRGRITRRPFLRDPAIDIHYPGVKVALEFGRPGKPADIADPERNLVYQATDFAPLLLKRVVAVAALMRNIERRGELLELADRTWDHVVRRKLADGVGRDLWDQPAHVYDILEERYEQPTWHHTLRVVESLVLAADLANSHPIRSVRLVNFAHDLLAEAEHLFDKEQLRGSTDGRDELHDVLLTVGLQLRWARQSIDDRPGSATANLLDILRTLDKLAAARSDVAGAL